MVADYLYENSLNDELEFAADSAANAVISNPNKPIVIIIIPVVSP